MSMYLYPISSTLENGTQPFLNRNKKQTLGTHMVHIYTILVYSHFARDFETPGIELSWNYLAEDLVQQSTSLGALALGVFLSLGGVSEALATPNVLRGLLVTSASLLETRALLLRNKKLLGWRPSLIDWLSK